MARSTATRAGLRSDDMEDGAMRDAKTKGGGRELTTLALDGRRVS